MKVHDHLSDDIREIRSRFFADPTGFSAETELSKRVDEAVLRGWDRHDLVSGCVVLAIGGYGRQTLHPNSDLDLLVFFEQTVVEKVVTGLLSPLWDLPFRVGHQIRQQSDFDSFDVGHMESYTAFMDARFLWGDPDVGERFIRGLLPQFVKRHAERLLSELIRMKDRRWASFGQTVFQLEPDVKSAPGGLRDQQWTRWTSYVRRTAAVSGLEDSVSFLHRIRNYLHFLAGQDQNTLTYEFQEKIAEQLKYADSHRGEAAELLMHDYFLKAECIAERVQSISEEISGRVNRVVPTRTLKDTSSILGAFAEAHKAKLDLDTASLNRVRDLLEDLPAEDLASGENGRAVLEMMKDRKGIYNVLRSMHRVGFLGAVFPEFEEIRCRVIRDFFHKYTVDQHSLTAIHNIELLGEEGQTPSVPRGFQTILSELEHPELLLLSLLLHDTGKAAHHPIGDHACTSVEVLAGVLDRLALPVSQQDRIRAAIENHLEMSKVIMQRDITDPEVVAEFASLVGTQEDLRILCLMTYADMKAVSPEVWTSWKGELLFQLYVETFNRLQHDFAEDRYAEEQFEEIDKARVRRYLPSDLDAEQLSDFLEGLPAQFLRSTSAERLASYFAAFVEFSSERVSVIQWFRRGDLWEVLVIASDSPLLLSRITGALAAFGMSTVRAQAFSNRRGIIFDLIAFEDPGGRLESNPSEIQELETLLSDSIMDRVDLERLIQRRSSSVMYGHDVSTIPISVRFDSSSGKRTIMEIVAGDSVGLLFNISRAIGILGCDIEVALVSTEGRRAMDVFYLNRGGGPLSDDLQEKLKRKVEEAIAVGARPV